MKNLYISTAFFIGISLQASAADIVAINMGGPAAGNFVADEFYSGSTTYVAHHTDPVDTNNVPNPPPQAVYQTLRFGKDFTYAIPNLTKGAAYTVRLNLDEPFFERAKARLFNVKINGVQVLTNFDIFANAGSKYKAIAESFNTTADSNGRITIEFTAIANEALVAGIEIADASGNPPPPPPPPPATGAGHVIAGYEIYPEGDRMNRDVYNESPVSNSGALINFVHNAGVSGTPQVTQAYVLHIMPSSQAEFRSVGTCSDNTCGQSSSHAIPSLPIGIFTTQGAATGNAGDRAIEILETGTSGGEGATLWDGYYLTLNGGSWYAYSACKLDPSVNMLTNQTCNSTSDWDGIAIAGSLAPEELTGVWKQPGATYPSHPVVNHALVLELPVKAYSPGGLQYGNRLRLHANYPQPSDPQASAVVTALKHHGLIAAENGCCFGFGRMFVPQSGDANYNPAVNDALESLHITDFDVVP